MLTYEHLSNLLIAYRILLQIYIKILFFRKYPKENVQIDDFRKIAKTPLENQLVTNRKNAVFSKMIIEKSKIFDFRNLVKNDKIDN